MPTWREVIEDEDYKNLSLGERIKTKNEFFKNIISQSDKFKKLSPQERIKTRTDFFTPKPEEKVEPFLPEKPSFGQIAKYAVEEFQQKSPFKYLDQPVEQIAKFIEPRVPAGRTTAGLLVKDLPRQMLAEIVRTYKPSTVAPFMLGAKAISPIAKPIGRFIAKRIPEGIKKVLTRELFVGKGQPQAYQAMAKEAQLERAIGGREAQEVAKKLTVASQDIKGITKEGVEFTIKKGQPIPREYQQYIGRIFRKEIDLGGRKSFATLSSEESARIAKDVEVNVAFNPKVQSLQSDLELVNKALRDKETLAKGLVGKEFRTETGFIEKVTEVSKVPKIKPSGKPSAKRFDIGVVTEPVSPVPPTVSPIPSMIAGEEEKVVRGIRQISKLPTVNKFLNLSRQGLLQQRKQLSKQLQNEILDIEVGVRTKYFSFDRTFTEQIRTHPKYQQLADIADEGRAVMDKWSTELAKSGIPKEQTAKVIEENIGSYMARMYTSKLKPETGGFNLFKNLRLRLNGLKHRKDLSAEVLMQLGEIKEPALPTAIRVREISSSIANNKLFSQVAKNPEWVASSNVTGNMIKMPDSVSVGVLKGKWVIPEIGEDINAIVVAGKQSQGIYLKMLNAWKFGKVVLNPATQVRNAISNTMLLDMSGTNHLKQARLFPKAFNELLSKGKVYQDALDDGAIGGEFVGGEIQRLRDFYLGTKGNNLQRWIDIAKMPFRKASDLYQGMEQSAKLVKYMDVLEKGGTREVAAQEAQKWLFNYQEVPKIIDFIRKSPLGAPFATFSYKAIPRLAETLVNRPMTLYKYKALFEAFNETSRKYQGMSPIDYAKEKKSLPDWILKDIGGMPANLLLPYKDKYNRTQWLNLEYILPVGMAPEIMEKGILKGGIGNPFFNILADLTKNIDFRGKPIFPPEATPQEAMQAAISHVYRQIVPSLAPSIPPITKGGYSFEKVMDAIYERPDFIERTRDLTPVLFDVLMGLKVNPVDVGEAEQFKMWDKKKRIDELQKQVLKLRHPAISEKEREKQAEILFKKMQKVLDEH
jgi:hypothetical protein